MGVLMASNSSKKGAFGSSNLIPKVGPLFLGGASYKVGGLPYLGGLPK